MNRNDQVLSRLLPDNPDNDSSTSDNDDQILQQVIREGMPKFPVKALKENPVDMMRSGAPLLPPYLPVVDETNRFLVEDSPCNFSVMSALSAITIESNMQAGPSKPRLVHFEMHKS